MTTPQESFRAQLFDAGVLFSTGIDGLYLRSASYQAVLRGVDKVITELGRELEPFVLHAPLLVPRSLLERTDYIRSFPDLLGSVASFSGGQREFAALLEDLDQDRDWTDHLGITDLGLCSAACHSIYPLIHKDVVDAGQYYEIFGQCYRHEPSIDPLRMQAFHMHELVCVAGPAAAYQYRQQSVDRCEELFNGLGLAVRPVIANDPFFGRSGAMLATNQREEALKIELVLPLFSEENPTAITSVNLHRDHFGVAFDISTESGEVAHSACIGFGVDRIALSLFHTHGLEATSWPSAVRDQLGL